MQKCEAGRDFANPPRYSKVSCYMNRAMIAAKVCMTLIACSAVILTDSVNSNMVIPHERATAEAPATAIRRTLVGGYEVFSRFTTGNGLPLFATFRRGCEPRRKPAQHPGQGIYLQRTNLLTSCRVGFQFFMANVMCTPGPV